LGKGQINNAVDTPDAKKRLDGQAQVEEYTEVDIVK
jgi:hypothetical protein